ILDTNIRRKPAIVAEKGPPGPGEKKSLLSIGEECLIKHPAPNVLIQALLLVSGG
ncbi:hypothetical protein Ancab_032498, partial [Ancistrocladus abbreviatus]